jgi:hypothetical protein
MELIRSTQDAMSIAETFYNSGMFTDIKSSSQAMVKIMAGQEFGIPPFAAMSGIHLIKGKPTIGAGLMATRVKKSGKYTYNVLQLNDAICEIEFIQLPKTVLGISKFTAEDAKRAGTGEAGGMNLMGKFPKNMLFARAISNGVRWFTPDIYESVVYVPEEMQEVEQLNQPIQQAEVLPALTDEAVIHSIECCKSLAELKTLYNSDSRFANYKQLFSIAKTKLNEVQKDDLQSK